MVVVKQMSDTATGTEKKAVILKYPNNPTADGKWTNKIVHFEHGLGQLTGLVRFEFGDMGKSHESHPI
jgi:hypothetical protein